MTESATDRLDQPPPIAGVLIGGRSRRMGSPKALLPHRTNGTYVEHVVTVAQRAGMETVLLGTANYSLPRSLDHLARLADVVDGGGPLAGLAAMLDYAGPRWTVLLSCDLPRLDIDALALLLRHIDDDADAVAFRTCEVNQRVSACCACYHGGIAGIVKRRLASADRSLHGLLNEVRTHLLDVPASILQQLTDVNTPSERV